MNYQQTLDWLFAQMPMYQRVGGANYKIDLEKTLQLMSLLKNPQNGFKSIHVAGTNGKGSTSHLMASALQEKGLKVGLYTSPHLKDFRERIKINGNPIAENDVIEFVELYKSDFLKLQLSFFEMTVGLAFEYFKKQNVDIAIIEVGMGGRLDSTNVLQPLVSIITNIGLDHVQFLGNDLASISKEKAGIIKKETPVVIGKKQEETLPVFVEIAKQKKAPLHFAQDKKYPKITSDLTGIYQEENKATAWTALQLLPENLKPNTKEIFNGFNHVVNNTGLLGRWQTLSKIPLTICDTGHNEDGIKQVLKQIKQTEFKNLHIVWGMVNDKNIVPILKLLPKNAYYYFAKPDLPRGLESSVLLAEALILNLNGKAYESVLDAVAAAKKCAAKDDLIFIGGSTFVVAEAI